MGNFQQDGGRADVGGKGAAGCGGSASAAEGGVALALSDLISSRPRCTAALARARAQLLTLVGFIFCRLLEPSRANCEAGADASSSKDVAAAAAAAAAEDADAVAAAPAAASDANAAAIESSVPTPHTTSLDAE